MTKKFEYTMHDGEMTVMVEFNYVEFVDWIDQLYKETYIDEVTITSIKCRDWEMLEIFRNNAPNEWWNHIYDACHDVASSYDEIKSI